ncbi:MAG TPA: single-stranded-DNA-specific exonuclease RecJ [Longimicrobiales bacterium]|nr:single-stranded-DNA-specific exonuclease RecJ [Longimicrobiales bacterium]
MPTASATKHWRPRSSTPPDPGAIAELAAATGLPEPFCSLLVARGHSSLDDARAFLKPSLDCLLDPFLMRDMDRAVERIQRAIRDRETILVHGDYDVDGICSAALYTRVLRRLGARAEAFAPNRFLHGYDLGQGGVDAAAAIGARLLLTSDCGTLAHAAIERARAVGIDVVVTDHHAPGDTLPDAVAVVNPNRVDCDYPTKGLSGTGVAFKLCEALWGAAGLPREELLWHLDLVALATIADLVPLTGENRVLARFGLRVLRDTRNPGLRAVMAAAGLDPARVDAGTVGHVIGPRLNAAGRVRDARWALDLLLTDSASRAAELAAGLEDDNRERRDLDRRTLREALDELDASGFDAERDFAVVLAREDWHPGVIGIVASRIAERVHRPAVLIALRGGAAGRGSGRSIRGFDLVDGLRACASMLDRFGGHRAAAGLDIQPDRVDEFRDALNRHARASLTPADLTPSVIYDVELGLDEATPELVRLLRHLGPFGKGNPAPVFLVRGVRVPDPPRALGTGGDHARLTLTSDGAALLAVGFRIGARLCEPGACDGPLDVVLQLQVDHWRGEERLEARLLDVRATEATVDAASGGPASDRAASPRAPVAIEPLAASA